MWSGNWILGRALRESFDPIALNFWRWLVALLILAPFAAGAAWQKRAVIRRHAGLLAFLALAGVVAFQSLVYLGLESTTAINAVLINASAPAFSNSSATGSRRARLTFTPTVVGEADRSSRHWF